MIDNCPRHEVKLETYEGDCKSCFGSGVCDDALLGQVNCYPCSGTGQENYPVCEKCNEENV